MAMTQQISMSQQVGRQAFRLRFLIGAAVSFGLIALAIFFQHQDDLVPCPLCIFQRIAFAATGALFLIGALWNPASASMRRVAALLTMIPALIGLGIAGRHVWLTYLPESEVPKCGPGLEYLMESMPTNSVIRTVLTGSGECAKVDWRLLGLSMPEWSLIAFIGLVLWILLTLFRAR